MSRFNKFCKWLVDDHTVTTQKETAGKSVRGWDKATLNISEPIYTIVQKIKDNPKRLKFTTNPHYTRTSTMTWVTDRVTGMVFTVEVTRTMELCGGILMPLAGQEFKVTTDFFSITIYESDYIVKELAPYYESRIDRLGVINNKRKGRTEKCNRAIVLKQWEDS
jgi:hypothetical protein